MEWPQSQCLHVQVAQRLSIQIRICRDLWQQISLCQQPGREDKPPFLSGQQLCHAELPWIIPSWSRAGSALSQDWAMWVPVVRPDLLPTNQGCSAGYQHPHGAQLHPTSQHWGAAIHHCWWIIPKIILSWLPHGIFSSWQRICSANANPTISVTGFFAQPSSLAFFLSSFVGLFLADDNRMLSIYFCSCLTLTQMGTGVACTCPLSWFEGRPDSAVTFYSTELSLLD